MNRHPSHEPGHSHTRPHHSELAQSQVHADRDTPDQPAPAAPERAPETLLPWRQEWCTGSDFIDEDHREMVRLVNDLQQSDARWVGDTSARSDDRGVLARFESLIEHLRDHFAREETLMREIDDPDIQVHQCEHSLQLAELAELRRRLAHHGHGGLDPETLSWIKRWCCDHLVSEDRRLAESFARANAHRDP